MIEVEYLGSSAISYSSIALAGSWQPSLDGHSAPERSMASHAPAIHGARYSGPRLIGGPTTHNKSER